MSSLLEFTTSDSDTRSSLSVISNTKYKKKSCFYKPLISYIFLNRFSLLSLHTTSVYYCQRRYNTMLPYFIKFYHNIAIISDYIF